MNAKKYCLFAMTPMLFVSSAALACTDDSVPCIDDASIVGNPSFTLSWEDNFSGGSVSGNGKWKHNTMETGEHKIPANYPTQDGRRWSAWYDDHETTTSYIDTWTYTEDVLIQRGIVDYSVTDPERDESYFEADGPENVNYGDFRFYTSFLTTHGITSDANRLPLSVPQHRWSPGHYFEIKVNFENMSMGGHRHSFWLMPAEYDVNGEVIGGNVAYDNNPSNGVEIDIYEYEAAPSTTENSLYMKVLGNPLSASGTGNTDNELATTDRHSGISYSGGGTSNEGGLDTVVTTTSIFPGGLLTSGWHKVGLYWSSNRLVWFLDGYPVVEDTVIVPTVPHYLLMSRELNSGVLTEVSAKIQRDTGIVGENAAINRNISELGVKNLDGTEDFGLQNRDHVVVDYVKVWSFSTGGGGGGSGISEPTNVAGTRYSHTAAEIVWDPPTNSGAGLDHYEVTRDGTLGFSGSGESWWMTDLTQGQDYTFEVTAVDINSVVSSVSCLELGFYDPASGNTQAVPCGGSGGGGGGGNSPPTIPGSFTGTVYSSSTLELFWNHSTDSDGTVVEYVVTNETTSTEVKRDYVTSALATGLSSGTTYDFSIVAIDNLGASSTVATVQLTTN